MYSKLLSRLCSLNISVLGVGEQGFWEGRVNNNEGMFPSNFVQEVKLRRKGMKKINLSFYGRQLKTSFIYLSVYENKKD